MAHQRVQIRGTALEMSQDEHRLYLLRSYLVVVAMLHQARRRRQGAQLANVGCPGHVQRANPEPVFRQHVQPV